MDWFSVSSTRFPQIANRPDFDFWRRPSNCMLRSILPRKIPKGPPGTSSSNKACNKVRPAVQGRRRFPQGRNHKAQGLYRSNVVGYGSEAGGNELWVQQTDHQSFLGIRQACCTGNANIGQTATTAAPAGRVRVDHTATSQPSSCAPPPSSPSPPPCPDHYGSCWCSTERSRWPRCYCCCGCRRRCQHRCRYPFWSASRSGLDAITIASCSDESSKPTATCAASGHCDNSRSSSRWCRRPKFCTSKPNNTSSNNNNNTSCGGCEASCRWRNPRRNDNIVSPQDKLA